MTARLLRSAHSHFRARRDAAWLHRLAATLPHGAHLCDTGEVAYPTVETMMEHLRRIDASYRCPVVRRRWLNLVRPFRLANLRFGYQRAGSRLQRIRHGIGAHDSWSLGDYLCTIAARGLRVRGTRPEITTAREISDERQLAAKRHAQALEAWATRDQRDPPSDPVSAHIVGLRDAQGALRWIAHHLVSVSAPPRGHAGTGKLPLRTAVQRVRFGIADRDTADLGRYLSLVAAHGMRHTADHGHGYPTSRIDDAQWAAELHQAAHDLEQWALPARFEADIDHRLAVQRAQLAWSWIADNLNDLWD